MTTFSTENLDFGGPKHQKLKENWYSRKSRSPPLNGEHSRAILVDFGSPSSSGAARPAECAEALEPQDSSFQFSSIAFDTVARGWPDLNAPRIPPGQVS